MLRMHFVGFQVLTAVVRKSTIFWDTMPCSPLKGNRYFGGSSTTMGSRILYNGKLQNSYSSRNIIKVIESGGGCGRVARMEDIRNAYKSLVGKSEEKTSKAWMGG
jgi:hypothetical protein